MGDVSRAEVQEPDRSGQSINSKNIPGPEAKRSTITLHSGSLLLTMFVIAISRAAREIRVRFATG
jgi:hypothetical protein